MPSGPLPPELVRFLSAPRRAVVGTVRPDGAPATTATWYELVDGSLLLSMTRSSPRHRNVRSDPRISLTVMGDDWYNLVTLRGEVTELRPDAGLADLDALSQRYYGTPYPKRELDCVTAITRIDRWHTWGTPRSRRLTPVSIHCDEPSRAGGPDATQYTSSHSARIGPGRDPAGHQHRAVRVRRR